MGIPASRGIAIGFSHTVISVTPSIPLSDDPVGAFTRAAAAAASELDRLASEASGEGQDDATEILTAQSLMATDPTLSDLVLASIANGVNLDVSLTSACDVIRDQLLASEDPYLAERANDVSDVARRIRFALAGVDVPRLIVDRTDVVLVADQLSAADVASLDSSHVAGVIVESGGPTGHVAIIARSKGIPAVVGAPNIAHTTADGVRILLDGGIGEIVIDPDPATLGEFELRRLAEEELARVTHAMKGTSVRFGDSQVSIAANIGDLDELSDAAQQQADGIGLFRTEFLFLNSHEAPAESVQVDVYTDAVEAFDHPVVVRMLDIGADKPVPYVDLETEANPFLGRRGVRLYESYADVVLTQVRALLRAAAFGELWVMAPMIATVDDVRIVEQLFERAKESLHSAGIPHGDPKIGIMIEVPSAALNADALAEHVDFFSIGTNDLTQYTMAADRASQDVAAYSRAEDPAVLKLCAMTIAAANRHGVPVCVCGEAAADPALAPVFAAMGADKLSVAPRDVNYIKHTVSHTDADSIRSMVDQLLSADSAETVRALLSAQGGA